MERDRLAAELTFVKHLASEAAQVALARAQGVSPQEKANLSYVTDLDHDLERLIRTRLGEAYPDDLLTGEEYEAEGGNGARRWSIDPIDGTGNLVHRLPLWAISIGLIEAGEPVLGVIAVPPPRRDVLGGQGGGCLAGRQPPDGPGC
jgi:fructose-1,6-bisphosphatase/inositol monophosphatase family enzyme